MGFSRESSFTSIPLLISLHLPSHHPLLILPQHLSFNHPPNKCEVIQRGGIPLTINVLTHFSSSRDIVQQALAVLFNLLTEDNRTKVNMSSVRQMALTAGIIDIIQAIEKKHGRENQGIKGLCQGILNSLITEWS
jgi:hypothetical protein